MAHLTCGGDAVKAYEGIKTGGGTRKDPRPAERHEATRPEDVLRRCRTGQTGDSEEERRAHWKMLRNVFWPHASCNPLQTGVAGAIKDFLRVQTPVFQVSFDEARDDDKHEHNHIDAGEDFIDPGRLLHSKRKQA